MKKLLTSLAFLLILSNHNNIKACSCPTTKSFCESFRNYDVAVSGVVIDNFPNGISLKVLKVLNGTETRDTIRVLDLGGPYNLCNDSATDSRAQYLGKIGDTLILALPKIIKLKNTWDKMDDYRTPGFSCERYKLTVTNGIVNGRIAGSEYCAYMKNCVDSDRYTNFIENFATKSFECGTWLSVSNAELKRQFNFYPNPSNNQIVVTTSERGTVSITNPQGQIMDVISVAHGILESNIYLDNYKTGLYFLNYETEKFKRKEKLIVQKK